MSKNGNNKKLYNTREIGRAFKLYFYGSGADFFFPHPKLDETPEKECKEVVEIRCNDFLEILAEKKRSGEGGSRTHTRLSS